MSNEDAVTSDALLPAVLAGLGALFVSILIGAALSSARDAIGLENVTIIYMAVVAIAAIAGGTPGGLMAALSASLSYNFFFTTPYRTLRIDSYEQVMTVALLFVAGALISVATNAIRGRLLDSDEDVPHPPDGETVELLNSVARVKANDNGANTGRVAVQGLQRLHAAQWVALIPFDDARDRPVVWAGDPPTADEAGTQSATGSVRPRRRHPRGTGAVAHVFMEKQHPAVLVVMPRPGRPVTEAMRSTVRAVAQALETDVMQSSHTSHGD